MKLNETVPVTIAGQQVAQATVKEIGDGTVTLMVPATLVVMATRTEITTPEPTAGGAVVMDTERVDSLEPNTVDDSEVEIFAGAVTSNGADASSVADASDVASASNSADANGADTSAETSADATSAPNQTLDTPEDK